MSIFVATSYSSKVDYTSGQVFPEYQRWLEDILITLERAGYEVFCALRDDKYIINDANPATAFRLDTAAIKRSDALLALLDDHTSAGVQLEIGYALALGKKIYLAHLPEHQLTYINKAVVRTGLAKELLLPLSALEHLTL